VTGHFRVATGSASDQLGVAGITLDEFAKGRVADPDRRLVAVIDGGQGKALTQLGSDRIEPGQYGDPAAAPRFRAFPLLIL
jgi:hypothetical protein